MLFELIHHRCWPHGTQTAKWQGEGVIRKRIRKSKYQEKTHLGTDQCWKGRDRRKEKG